MENEHERRDGETHCDNCDAANQFVANTGDGHSRYTPSARGKTCSEGVSPTRYGFTLTNPPLAIVRGFPAFKLDRTANIFSCPSIACRDVRTLCPRCAQ